MSAPRDSTITPEYREKLLELYKRIEANPSLIDRVPKNVLEDLRRIKNPYGKVIGTPDKGKYLAFSIINVTEKYAKNFAMTSLAAFLYRMAKEWEPEDMGTYTSESDTTYQNKFKAHCNSLVKSKKKSVKKTIEEEYQKNMKDWETMCELVEDITKRPAKPKRAAMPQVTITDDIKAEANKLAKGEMGIQYTAEEYRDQHYKIIKGFLDNYLKFDPDNHVESVYLACNSDPTVKPIPPSEINKYDPLNPDKLVIPPRDTFERWRKYEDQHFEEIRETVNDIYREKPDFEFAIVPHLTSDNLETLNKFKEKFAGEFESSVRIAKYGEWTLLASWKANQDKIEFYNKNTEIIKKMLEANERDQRLAEKMLKKRMDKQDKKVNPKDKSAVDKYVKLNPPPTARMGVSRLLEEKDKVPLEKRSLTSKDIPRDDGELPDDKLEIKIIDIKAKKEANRIIREVEETKTFIDSEPLDNVKITNPFSKEESS